MKLTGLNYLCGYQLYATMLLVKLDLYWIRTFKFGVVWFILIRADQANISICLIILTPPKCLNVTFMLLRQSTTGKKQKQRGQNRCNSRNVLSKTEQTQVTGQQHLGKWSNNVTVSQITLLNPRRVVIK